MIAGMVRIADGIIFKQVGDEIVLLDFERGIYFGLDAVGARIWELIASGHEVDAIVDTLADEYDVARETLASDVAELIAELKTHGLLQSA